MRARMRLTLPLHRSDVAAPLGPTSSLAYRLPVLRVGLKATEPRHDYFSLRVSTFP